MIKNTYIYWENKKLAGTIHFPLSYQNGNTLETKLFPVFIICHGFVGSRIGVNRLFVKASEEISFLDAIVVRFDYVGCGESEGNYGENSLDDLIDQTKCVIDFALTISQVDVNQLVLIGHSLGGAVSLLTAASDKRIHKLILWAAVANPYSDIVNIVGVEQLKSLEFGTEIDYLGYSLKDKFFNSLVEHQPLDEALNFSGDVLVVHGSGDEEISVEYCDRYYDIFGSRRKGICGKQVIEGADHTFSTAVHYRQLMDVTKKWLLSVN